MKTIEIEIPDMSCGHCVQAVGNAIQAVAGVASADVSLENHRATVAVTADVEPGQLLSAVQEAGYSPELAPTEEDSE